MLRSYIVDQNRYRPFLSNVANRIIPVGRLSNCGSTFVLLHHVWKNDLMSLISRYVSRYKSRVNVWGDNQNTVDITQNIEDSAVTP